MQDELAGLQAWYEAQCDGDWEHDEGIAIGTLDNPGWSLRINLVGTELENRQFSPVEDMAPEQNWLRCWLEDGKFHAVGGPTMLAAMIRTFLDWAEADLDAKPWLRPNGQL